MRIALHGFLLIWLLSAVPSMTAQVVTRGPYLQQGRENAVIVRWRTDIPTTSAVNFGQSPTGLVSSAGQSNPTTEHEVLLSGLSPETRYWYAIGSASSILLQGPQLTFETAPPRGARRPFRAWVLGDSGTQNSDAARVKTSYLAFEAGNPAEVLLMLGDNAYSSGTDAEYQAAVFEMYPEILPRMSLWPALGNHDAASTTTVPLETGPYYDIFSLPKSGEAGGLPSGSEGYYSFDHANAHFICLNSAQGDVAYVLGMGAWLQADLQSTTQEWVIAYWHHPPYSKGSHDSDTNSTMSFMRAAVLPLLESAGVDLVLSGHSHSYERSVLLDGHYGPSSTLQPFHVLDAGNGSIAGSGPYKKPSHGASAHEGAVYVVAGSSGQVTMAPLNHPVMVQNLAELGSVVLDFWGAEVLVSFLDQYGGVADSFTVVKGGASPSSGRHLQIVGREPLSISLPKRSRSWRYYDQSLAPPALWSSAGFNDYLWLLGRAPFGYGQPSVLTPTLPGPDPNNVTPTQCFRHVFFQGAGTPNFSGMSLDVAYEDGFIAYLNGVEVARSSTMPPGPGNFSAFTVGPHGSLVPERTDLTPFLPLLQPGRNVLAVEVHQDAPQSTSLFFDAAFFAWSESQVVAMSDAGIDYGTAWRQPGFDDSAWARKPMPFGYGFDGVATTTSTSPTVPPTVYARKSFDLPMPVGVLENLKLVVNYDDAFVAHLNGVEVARSSNLPSGPVAFSTLATSSHEAGTPEAISLAPYAGVLLQSGNILALEVHQVSLSSSDLYFECALLADVARVRHLEPCGESAFRDSSGEPENVLLVNGSDGGFARSVDVPVNSPIGISLDLPSQSSAGATFALAVKVGSPSSTTGLPLGPGSGALCITGFEPSAFLLATSIPGLPGVLPASALPFSWTLPTGLPGPIEFSLQALISTPAAGFRATNALMLRIVP